MHEDMKQCIRECLSILEDISVKSTEDCWRKVQMHDKLALLYNLLAACAEKKGEEHGELQSKD